MSNVNEYSDSHRAPCNDGLWQKDFKLGKYSEILDIGGGYSVNLVDLVLGGIEPYKGCSHDLEFAYDYDNGFSKRTLSRLLSSIKRSKQTGNTPMVKIYRTVPNHVTGKDDAINDGDWITLSPVYAKIHGDLRYTDNYHILTLSVPANHIYWDGQHISEFGYDSRQFEWNKEKSLPKCSEKQTCKAQADQVIHSDHLDKLKITEGKKASLSDQIQSASTRATESHSFDETQILEFVTER